MYGRMYRLLKAQSPVKLEVNIETTFTGDHEHGFNTVAEIPGSDPKLKDRSRHGRWPSRQLDQPAQAQPTTAQAQLSPWRPCAS